MIIFVSALEGVAVGALLGVRGVGAEAEQRGADVVARLHRGRRVGAVVLEDVAPQGNAVRLREPDQLVRQVIVERARHVLHAHRRRMLRGVLPRRGDRDVQAHQLGHLAVQRGRGARADLLGQGQQRMDVDRQRQAVVAHRLARGQQRRHRRLVVEVARVDVAAGLDLRLGIDRDPVADVDAGGLQPGAIVHRRVDPDLDVVPAHRLGVDLVAEGMARALQRQTGAAQPAGVGEDRQPRALGETRRPVADRHDRQAAVVLERAHHRAEGVEVGDDRARRPFLAAGQGGADRAAAREHIGNPERFEAPGGVTHRCVGQADRAGNRQQLQQHLLEVGMVDVGDHSLRPR